MPLVIKQYLFKAVSSYAYRNADYILGNSSYYHQLLKQQGYPHVSWYCAGVKLPAKFKRQTKYPQIFTFGYLGRLYPDKGPEYLIHAYHQFKTKFPKRYPKTRLIIGGDGPLRPTLEDLVNQYKLDSQVTFLGSLDRWELMSQIDLLINPCTVKPALEMVNIEAAATGIPVICFGDSRRPVTVIDQQTGIKLPSPDSSSLAQAMHALATTNTLYKKFSTGGQRLYQESFTFDNQSRQLARVYDQVVNLSKAKNHNN